MVELLVQVSHPTRFLPARLSDTSQELAERRTRASMDRRLISSSTSRKMRRLFDNGRIYHPSHRRHLPHRGGAESLTEFLRSPPDELAVEDDDDADEFETMMEMNTEGARINPELYEAYDGGNNSSSWAGEHPFFPPREDGTASPADGPAHPRDLSPPVLRRTTSRIFPPTSTTLARQPSVRRPRSRVVDFNDFAARRRSTARDAHNNVASSSTQGSSSDSNLTITRSRRFFPFPRTQPPSWTTTAWTDDGENGPHPPEPSTSTAWIPVSAYSYPTPAPGSPNDAEPPQLVSRSHRSVGHSPDMSTLSRHVSPDPAPTLAYHRQGPRAGSVSISTAVIAPFDGEDTAYPTPGPQENDSQ